MPDKNGSFALIDIEQLKKYAADLAEVYRSEKQKRQALTTAHKQLVKYADDLAKTYESLQGSEKRYRALFEYAPISLWEEDLSQVKSYIDGLRKKGIADFGQYFSDHPEAVKSCVDMIKVTDVNKATLDLYEADTKEDYLGNLNKILAERPQEILIEELAAIAEGKSLEIECVDKTLQGNEITVLIKSTIPPGFEKTWSKVHVSVQDLTERSRAEFLKKMFGRYMSEEVMNTLIDNPEAVSLGGEKRPVTIMMSDLRGFAAISERLGPEKVVQMLNAYFEVMVEIVLKHKGTINEIMGDAMLVIFGAPQQMPDRAQRAISCAIEMQNAMAAVNQQNRTQGLPELEMGIGLNDDEVIVGNVGSIKRSKYGVVGSGVNMTGRIESYTVGGQILISKSVRKEAGEALRIDRRLQVSPKGAETELAIYEVGGIGEPYNLTLEITPHPLATLTREIPVRYAVLEGKHAVEGELAGAILRLSRKSGEVRLQTQLDLLTDLKLNLSSVSDDLSQWDFYGKVVAHSETEKSVCTVRFTGLPPAVDAYFQASIDQGATTSKP
jgi:class 3 adenylate cyclase/PAS domain-containing protein